MPKLKPKTETVAPVWWGSKAGDSSAERCAGLGRLQPRTRTANIPDRRFVVDEIDPKLWLTICDLVDGKAPWPFLLFGEVQSGKTCAALCMLELCGGWYARLPDFLELLIDAQQGRLTVGGDTWTVTDVWAHWESAPLAVLDDVGQREVVSDHHYESLKRAIDKRCEDCRVRKPTVIISNANLGGISDIYDERIASRLCDGTQFRTEGDRSLMAYVETLKGAE